MLSQFVGPSEGPAMAILVAHRTVESAQLVSVEVIIARRKALSRPRRRTILKTSTHVGRRGEVTLGRGEVI
jgi:hypothetical protein